MTHAGIDVGIDVGTMLDVEFVQLTDDGKQRDHNEDYLGLCRTRHARGSASHGWLFALADGVGGHDHGEVASRTAVEQMQAGFRKAPPGEPLPACWEGSRRRPTFASTKPDARPAPGGSNMATTLVACALRYDRVVVAHAGDSRCYLIRGTQAIQLTRDHTVANEQARLGILSAKEAARLATQAHAGAVAGDGSFVNAEVSEHQIEPGDVCCCAPTDCTIRWSAPRWAPSRASAARICMPPRAA